MFCSNCGKSLADNALFCDSCGTKTAGNTPFPNAAVAGPVSVGGSGNILFYPDGKYRWIYEFPMLKNPTILFTVWKVLLIAGAFPALITFFSSLSDGFLTALLTTLKIFILVAGIFLVISVIAYLILAASYGWKYVVMFEMDEKTVTHAQLPKQFKKAQVFGLLTGAAGAARGNFSASAAGLLAASKSSMTSEFSNVANVIGLRKKNTVKVNQALAKNQVYAEDADFDFVMNFIASRCSKAKITEK